jgi:hypothetical protein
MQTRHLTMVPFRLQARYIPLPRAHILALKASQSLRQHRVDISVTSCQHLLQRYFLKHKMLGVAQLEHFTRDQLRFHQPKLSMRWLALRRRVPPSFWWWGLTRLALQVLPP